MSAIRTKARRLKVPMPSTGVDVEPDCMFRNEADLDQWYKGLVITETLDGKCYIVRDCQGKNHAVIKEHVEFIDPERGKQEGKQ